MRRRGFLQTLALAAQAQGMQPEMGPRPAIAYPRSFSGRNLQKIAFPLGGVGTGCISLGGRGQLRDWEIFNRADKGRTPSYALPAIWVKSGAAEPGARVLEARLTPPYEAASGLGPGNAPGLQRFTSATFTGEYPLARVAFRDPELPVRVTLEAFNPFVPLDAEASGMPIIVLRYKVKNTAPAPATVAIAWSIDNPVGQDGRVNEFRSAANLQGLLLTNPSLAATDAAAGSFALALLDARDGQVSHLTGWPKAKWWASPMLFWDDFSADGELGPEAAARNAVASLCLKRVLAPGAESDFTFLLAWHFPNRTPAGCGWSAPKGEENAIIGNHYTTVHQDAWEWAVNAAAALPAGEREMRAFLAAVRETTLPAPVKEAAMSNLSTLATPTSFRTADGVFRGFEGTHDQRGCCPGTCTHVWNYESATHFLQPALARSMREAAFSLSSQLQGVMPIRLLLPLNHQTGGTTAADGTMGQIIGAYLDWRLSGDRAWLARIWPGVRQALEFCWVPGGWDGDRDGVMEGAQHNTYDVEFYGPNPMCGIYYLGALRAAEEMARALGENAFASECRTLFENGRTWIDANLFNGEYYVQQVRGIPQEQIAGPLQSHGGAEDSAHPDFQLGEGCLVDQLVGQYVADFAGLGPLVDRAHIRKTLESIYKYNYKRSLYRHNSVQRIFALNDEAALVICDYGKGKRPQVPFPYFAEVMTGFEYSAAVLMLYYGMEKEGEECIGNIRRRYDGERRNPWDEAECGHHYARAMASWSGLLALSGFHYHGAQRRVTAMPRGAAGPFQSFWSTATGWGSFSMNSHLFVLAVKARTLPVEAVELRAATARAVTVGGRAVNFSSKRAADRLLVTLAAPVELTPAAKLEIAL